MNTHARTFARLALLGAILLCHGCLDMFNPTGGRYAQHRYGDPSAFVLTDRKDDDQAVRFTFTAQKPEAKIKLRSVYLIGAHTHGPHLPFDLTAEGRLTVAVPKADLAKYAGISIFGGYKLPERAIPGAKSVEINQDVFFDSTAR